MSNLTEERYRELKEEVDSAKTEANKAQGALDQLLERLETEFKCKSLKEAKALLEELQTDRDAAEKSFVKALKSYEEKWKQ